MPKRSFEHLKDKGKGLFDQIDEFDRLQLKCENFPMSVRRDLALATERINGAHYWLGRALRNLRRYGKLKP